MYKYTYRSITPYLRELASSFPVVVVTGARQVGKSTLIKHLFGDSAGIVTFDPLVEIENSRTDPDLFLSSHPTPLILDEIQYCPEVVPAIKRRIDNNRTPGQYIISGSQQWQVMKTLAESMAGRAVFCDLDHFSLIEASGQSDETTRSWLQRLLGEPGVELPIIDRIRTSFSLTEQLWRGFLPEAQFIETALVPAFHEGYVRTYIERDVRLLENVDDLRQFRRFYQLVAALTAQEISYSQLGRDIGIAPGTAQRWLSVLAGTFQVVEIPAFSGNAVKRISLKPKVHCTDVGMVCHNLAISSPSAIPGHPSWGAIFESACVMEILKQCHLMSPQPVVHHWRTHAGAEVDLLLEYDGRYVPIEVKSSSHPTGHDTRGIRALRETYPNLPIGCGYIVAPAEKTFQVGVKEFVIPWDGCVGVV